MWPQRALKLEGLSKSALRRQSWLIQASSLLSNVQTVRNAASWAPPGPPESESAVSLHPHMVGVPGAGITIWRSCGERHSGLRGGTGSTEGRGALCPQFGPAVEQVRIREQPIARKWRKKLMSSNWAEASGNESSQPGLSFDLSPHSVPVRAPCLPAGRSLLLEGDCFLDSGSWCSLSAQKRG